MTHGRKEHPLPWAARSDAPSDTIVWPIRRLSGWILAQSGWYRMRVAIELVPWSDHASALGLRPVARRQHPLGLVPYFRSWIEAVECLRDSIEWWAGARAEPSAA